MRRPNLLVVEDDVALTTTLLTILRPRVASVSAARTIAEARSRLSPAPDVVLLDYALPDGTAEGLFDDLAVLRPLPVVIAMSGATTTEEAFRLAQRGVSAFLSKPFDLRQLVAVWGQAVDTLPELDTRLRRAVGKVPLRSLEDAVRSTMVTEALALSNGSLRGAARLLSVSRQTLQFIVKRMQ
jgi:two-component system, response regulator RegA